MLYDSFKSNKKINNILKSEQFQYSEKIMELRIELELDIFEISEILNISPEKYLDIEYSSLDIPVWEYKNILEKLLVFKEGNSYIFEETKINADITEFSLRKNKKISSEIGNDSSFVLNNIEALLIA